MDGCGTCKETKKENEILREQVVRLVSFAHSINEMRECICSENSKKCLYCVSKNCLNNKTWGLKGIKIQLRPSKRSTGVIIQ